MKAKIDSNPLNSYVLIQNTAIKVGNNKEDQKRRLVTSKNTQNIILH